MTDDDVTAMFRPKLDVVALLHRLSVRHPVRQFVLFSSISGLTGSRWLAHYAATTTFLDTFAFARRAAGLPATAVNWGLWKSLSDSQSDAERKVTLDSGLEPLPDEVAIAALPWLIGPGTPVRSTFVAADWRCSPPPTAASRGLHIVDELLPTEPRRPARRCRSPNSGNRYATASQHYGAAFWSTTSPEGRCRDGVGIADLLDPAIGFFQSGMDSLMSVTLQRSLSDSLGESLPVSVVFDYPTVEALSDYLATILPELVEVADEETVRRLRRPQR